MAPQQKGRCGLQGRPQPRHDSGAHGSHPPSGHSGWPASSGGPASSTGMGSGSREHSLPGEPHSSEQQEPAQQKGRCGPHGSPQPRQSSCPRSSSGRSGQGLLGSASTEASGCGAVAASWPGRADPSNGKRSEQPAASATVARARPVRAAARSARLWDIGAVIGERPALLETARSPATEGPTRATPDPAAEAVARRPGVGAPGVRSRPGVRQSRRRGGAIVGDRPALPRAARADAAEWPDRVAGRVAAKAVLVRLEDAVVGPADPRVDARCGVAQRCCVAPGLGVGSCIGRRLVATGTGAPERRDHQPPGLHGMNSNVICRP